MKENYLNLIKSNISDYILELPVNSGDNYTLLVSLGLLLLYNLFDSAMDRDYNIKFKFKSFEMSLTK